MSFIKMKEKEDKENTLSEFQRYIRGEMTKREENGFQRKLHTDLFAKEVIEGFPETLPRNAAEDKGIFWKKFKKRINHGRKVYYGIAALVAVIMIVSSVFIILDRNKSARQLSGIVKPGPLAVTDPNKITESPVAESKDTMNLSGLMAEKGTTNLITDTAISAGSDNSENLGNKGLPAIPVEKDSDLKITQKQVSDQAEGLKTQEIPALIIRGKILSSESKLPLAGVKVFVKGTNSGVITDAGGNFKLTLPDANNRTLIAGFIGLEPKQFQAVSGSEMLVELNSSTKTLNEGVVVENAVAKNTGKDQPGFISPQPVDGNSNFRKYIEENIKKPLGQPQGEDAVAVVSFIVRTTGAIDSIKVISSPGDEFAREAIRLIREGPPWKPAEVNGRTIDNEVSLRIVFK